MWQRESNVGVVSQGKPPAFGEHLRVDESAIDTVVFNINHMVGILGARFLGERTISHLISRKATVKLGYASGPSNSLQSSEPYIVRQTRGNGVQLHCGG